MSDELGQAGQVAGVRGEALRYAVPAEEQTRLIASVVLYTTDAVLITEAWPTADPGPRILYANPAFERMTGYSAGEVLGRSPRLLQGPQTDRATTRRIGVALRLWRSIRVELLNYRKDGSPFWVELDIAPVLDERQLVTHWISIQRDVTERRRHEQVALRGALELERQVAARTAQLADLVGRLQGEVERRQADEARFRAVWESAGEAMVLSDGAGVVRLANPAYCRLYQLSPAEVIGQPFTVIFREDLRAGALASYRELFAAGGLPAPIEVLVRRHDGALVAVETMARKISLAGQRPLLLSVSRDISARRAAEEDRLRVERRLMEAQRLESLGALAGGLAHDFNNLLTTIMGHAELAMRDDGISPESRAGMATIVAQVQLAAGLTGQLLAYAGRGRVLVGPLQINRLIDELHDLLHSAGGVEHGLRLELGADLPMVEADEAQIRQLLINLVANAGEAIGGREGQITVASGLDRLSSERLATMLLGAELPAGDYVRLTVEDNGVGMDGLTLSRVFDPFFSSHTVGRGLGLAAVLGIVRSHRGAIEVASEPGRGTRFSVWLPAVIRRQPPPDGQAAPAGRRVAALIDDEPGVRTVAARMLEHLGFSTAAYERADLALADLEAGRLDPDVVLLDLTMPHMGGAEAARRLQQLRPGLPVLLISGYSAEEIDLSHPGLRVAGLLPKPFTLRDLGKRLGQLLGGAGQDGQP